MNPVKLLGLDPGFANLGVFGMTLGLGMKAEFARLILTEKNPKMPEGGEYIDEFKRLDEIEVAWEAVLDEFKPDVVAAERHASLRNAKACRQLALAFGAMRARALKRGIPFLWFHPEDIKEEVCGDRKADKAKMAKRLVGAFPSFNGWPELGNRKKQTAKRKVVIKKDDSVAHVVDAAGACMCARKHPVVEALLRGAPSAPVGA